MAKVQQKSEKIIAFGGIFFVLDKFDSIPAYYSHGSKFLPIHRGFAPHGRPLWNQGQDGVKSFLFRFIAVPAKWIKTARQYKLNIFSNKPYNLIWEHG